MLRRTSWPTEDIFSRRNRGTGEELIAVKLSNVRIERLRCGVPATQQFGQVDQLSNSQKHSTRTRNLKQTGTSHLQELAIYQTLNNPRAGQIKSSWLIDEYTTQVSPCQRCLPMK